MDYNNEQSPSAATLAAQPEAPKPWWSRLLGGNKQASAPAPTEGIQQAMPAGLPTATEALPKMTAEPAMSIGEAPTTGTGVEAVFPSPPSVGTGAPVETGIGANPSDVKPIDSLPVMPATISEPTVNTAPAYIAETGDPAAASQVEAEDPTPFIDQSAQDAAPVANGTETGLGATPVISTPESNMTSPGAPEQIASTGIGIGLGLTSTETAEPAGATPAASPTTTGSPGMNMAGTTSFGLGMGSAEVPASSATVFGGSPAGTEASSLGNMTPTATEPAPEVSSMTNTTPFTAQAESAAPSTTEGSIPLTQTAPAASDPLKPVV